VNIYEKFFSLKTMWERKRADIIKIQKHFHNYTGKIFIVSDVHIPFFDDVAVKKFFEIIQIEKPSNLIIAGDLINLDRFSEFLKLNRSVSVKKEIEKSREFCNIITKYCRNIYYLQSNHELRISKYLSKRLGEDVSEDIFDLGFSLTNLLKYNNLSIIDNWWINIADVVIGHKEYGRFDIKNSMEKFINFFIPRIKNFNCAIAGHTHKQSKRFYNRILGIETGCLAKTQDYAIAANSLLYDVQYLGFVILKLFAGKTDFNETNFYTIKMEDYLL